MLLLLRRSAKHDATRSTTVGSLTPMRILTSLAALGVGAALLWYHPGTSGTVILAWPRLLLLAAAAGAALFALERWLSRDLRGKDFSPYPLLFPVLLVLLAAGVVIAGAVNRVGPSATRTIRPRVLRTMDVVWRTVTPVGTTLPGGTPERDEEGIVIVDSWRSPGFEVQVPVPAAELDRAGAAHEEALEVTEADGFLGVPYVETARFVPR